MIPKQESKGKSECTDGKAIPSPRLALPRKTVLCLLASLAVTTLVLRYPVTSHELGIDSFFIHNLAVLIQVQGGAAWTLSPLSYFGLYPMSYPSAAPFFLAQFSDLAGQPIEPSILLLSSIYGVLGAISAFVMAREFLRNDVYALGVAFFYGLAPRFLDFTLWSMSARGLFMALLPIFVWSVIRAYRSSNVSGTALSLILFILLGATHHLTALLLVVVGAALAAGCVVLCLKLLRVRMPSAVLSRPVRRLAPIAALAAFVAMNALMIVGANVLPQYSQGELASGTTSVVEVLNLTVSLARSVGLSLVLGLAGVVILIRRPGKDFADAFVVLAFIGLTPTLLLRVYTGFYILPFIALLAGFAILRMAESRRRRLGLFALVGCFAAAGVLSAGVLGYEINHSSLMPMQTYATGVYVGHLSSRQVVLSSDGLLGVRVASISACAYLPVGGASTLYQSPEVLAYRFYTPQEVTSSVARVELGNVSIDSDSPFFDSSIQVEADWVKLMDSSFASQPGTLSRYHPTLFLETGSANATFSAYGGTYFSPFSASVYDQGYLLYSDGLESLWYIQAPLGSAP